MHETQAQKGCTDLHAQRKNEVSDRKHKNRDFRKVSAYSYDVTNYSECKPIPCENSNWRIDSRQWQRGNSKTEGPTWNKMNGLAEMYHHFRFQPKMKKNHVALRRIPCLCDSCYEQLSVKWVDTIKDLKKQEMFARPKDCRFKEVVGHLNDWQIVELKEKPGEMIQFEINLINEDALTSMDTAHEQTITKGEFGAIGRTGGIEEGGEHYNLVQWTSGPLELQ